MNYFFHPDAERELHQAVLYYEDIQAGLGREFAYEVHAAIMRIMKFPDSYAHFSQNTRRCIINRFPYGVLYAMKDGEREIYILAVMNLHRKPDFWQEKT